MAAPGTAPAWWQWLLLALLLLLLLAGLAWLVRPYLPHLEPRLEAEARDRALEMSVRQPAELQRARFDTLSQDNENLRLELARLTDELARRGGDCAAGVVVPGGVGVGGAPIERGAAPDTPGGPDVNVAGKDMGKEGVKDAGKDAGKDQGKGPDDKNVDKGNVKGPDQQDKNQDKNNGKDKNAAAKEEPKPMVVPPEAKQKQDVAFLKGDWRS